MRIKQQEGKNSYSCHKIVTLCVLILALSLLTETTNKLVKKHNAVHAQKWLIDRQFGHSGHTWLVWNPPWGALVLLPAAPAD